MAFDEESASIYAEKSGSDVVNSLLKANARLALLYIDINNNFNDIINYKNISILKSPLYKLKINTFSFKEIYARRDKRIPCEIKATNRRGETLGHKLIIHCADNAQLKVKFLDNNVVNARQEKSRAKSFLLQNIDKPDDDLIYALILKNLSDRQITIDKKLINYLIKRIDRSYSKIFDFIYKIDEISLKKKKSIDLKIIKEALGE